MNVSLTSPVRARIRNTSVRRQCGILVVPKREHPYLKLLYDRLESEGLEVVHASSIWTRDFLKNVLRVRIIHVHWIEYIILRNNLYTALVSLILAVLLLYLVKFILRRRIVITLHNVVPHETKFPLIERAWFLCALRLADTIFVHSRCALLTSLRLYGNMPHKYKITPHGHFIGYYGEKIEKSIARESLNIPVDALILCFLGGLRVYKGLELLRKVLPELLLEFPQLYVIIAGKPHDSQAISYLREVCAHDRVLCNLRYLSQEEILLHVSACDLGLIPYQQITTPGSAILYASYGVPIITSKKCAILELFEDGVFYYYETSSIIDSLKEILRKILENIHCLDVTGDLLKKIVQEHDWGSIAEVHKNQYQLLCILKG